MTKRFPAEFGNSGMYRDPNGTIPMPQPHNMPKAVWTQTRQRLDWGIPFAVTPVVNFKAEGWLWRVDWTSPFFDMRPDLRSSQGQPKEGVPIWRVGARLYVELLGQLNLGGGPAFSALSYEWFSPYDNQPGRLPVIPPPNTLPVEPNALALMAPTSNVTTAFFPPAPGASASMATFAPPGSSSGGGNGYPIRYWQVRTIFTRFVTGDTTAPPPVLGINDFLKLEAVVY